MQKNLLYAVIPFILFCSILLPNWPATPKNLALDGYPDLTVNGTSISLCGNHYYNEVKVINGGTILIEAYNGSSSSGWLNITASNILVDSGSKIDGSVRGGSGGAGGTEVLYPEDGEGPGKGSCGSGWPNGQHWEGGGGGGAGYGGNGGAGARLGGGGGLSYGSASDLAVDIGSGGGGGGGGEYAPAYGGHGGNGGAALFLNASGITIHGTINMRGENGGNGGVAGDYYCGGGGGGGSGGSILICGSSVNLNYACLNAIGGIGGEGGHGIDDNHAAGGGGGGGGGRIKIIYQLYKIQNYSTILDVSGGIGGSKSYDPGLWGGDGLNGTIRYDFVGTPPPKYLFQDLIVNGSSEIPPERIANLSGNRRYRNVVVINGGIVYVDRFNGSLSSGWLNITADSILIDSTSRVDARGAGYLGGNGGSGGQTSGPYAQGGNEGSGPGSGSKGNASVSIQGGGGGGGGGSYGGLGGYGGSPEGGGSGEAYGEVTSQVIQIGSGGGGGGGGGAGTPPSQGTWGGGGGNGAPGGGAVVLNALKIVINGIIYACGGDSGTNGGNGNDWDSRYWEERGGVGGVGRGGGGGGGGGGAASGGNGGNGGGGGGGGSGGGIVIIGGHMDLSGGVLNASGSLGGEGGGGAPWRGSGGAGGRGGGGRVKIFYVDLKNASALCEVSGNQNGSIYYEELSGFSLQASLFPSADTYVDEWNPTESYGASPDIHTCWDIAQYSLQYAYLKFDVSVLGLANVFKAELYMHEYGDNGAGSPLTGIIEQVHFVQNDTWNGNITWNSSPEIAASLDSVYTPGGSSGIGWHHWDVTSQTWSEMQGDGNLSLCVDTHNMNLTTGGLQIRYRSNESGVNVPYLTITYGIRNLWITNVTASPTHVMVGDAVNITVTVKNCGTFNESSIVTASVDHTLILASEFRDLMPSQSMDLLFRLDTADMEPGRYYNIGAFVNDVLGETDLGNNQYDDGSVWIGAIRIASMIPCDQFGNLKNTFKKGTVAYFNVTLNSTASETRNVLLTVNSIDSEGITMSMTSFQGPVSPGISTYILPAPISPSSHTGTARPYASALTDWAHNGGVPYCPEASTTFQVTEG